MNLSELEANYPALLDYTKNMPEDIRKHAIVKVHPAGGLIHQKNCELQYFGIIASGENRVINEFENGSIYLIENNRAIDFVGDVTLLAGLPRTSVTIEAVTESIVLYIPRKDAERWLESDNQFLRQLSRRVAFKLYRSSYNNGLKLFYPPSFLLIDYLVKYCQRCGMIYPGSTEPLSMKALPQKEPPSVTVTKTRDELEAELGINVKTLNRSIKSLSEEQYFSLCKGKIQLTKEQFLRCISYLDASKG